MTADAERWQRLVDDLAAAGVAADVEARPWQEGRLQGTTRTITIRRPAGGVVCIRDARNRADRWLGYDIHLEGPDGLVKRTYRWTTKRSVATANVLEALNREIR